MGRIIMPRLGRLENVAIYSMVLQGLEQIEEEEPKDPTKKDEEENSKTSKSRVEYDEALGQSVTAPSSGDFDANGFVDSVINFATENPAILAGGVAILAIVGYEAFERIMFYGVASNLVNYLTTQLHEDTLFHQ
ncbi:putative rhodanese-like domain-containing protein 4, chloroplastic [Sesbania bispinosa]|nr:putative rhodanese-like domain-containing protein 4, chloroplastic [Sesbania bispinosa]